MLKGGESIVDLPAADDSDESVHVVVAIGGEKSGLFRIGSETFRGNYILNNA